MMTEYTFDDLRPYTPSEIAPAMKRIAQSEYFEKMAAFVFPGKDVEKMRKMISEITSTEEFQTKVMSVLNEEIIRNSIRDFTYDGLEYLDKNKSYLFVSNHRDIVLDSSLLQQIFHRNGFRTTEITFGSNLMISRLIIDIGKSNKMFTVIRGAGMKDFYKNSIHLSEYIRHTVTEKKESIWIAQRNGRTKDGNDATDQGIVKMFGMSGPSGLTESISMLNIVPISLSYQIEPCDVFKTRELYATRNGEKYMKQKNEDLTSILAGMTEPKGDVHFSICEPLRAEELVFPDIVSPNDFYRKVAELIDRRIYAKYKLFDNNYIAHDIRSGEKRFSSFYTGEEKKLFEQRCQHILSSLDGDKDILSSIFLGIYANPVDKAPG
jgi:hypothetical protein